MQYQKNRHFAKFKPRQIFSLHGIQLYVYTHDVHIQLYLKLHLLSMTHTKGISSTVLHKVHVQKEVFIELGLSIVMHKSKHGNANGGTHGRQLHYCTCKEKSRTALSGT